MFSLLVSALAAQTINSKIETTKIGYNILSTKQNDRFNFPENHIHFFKKTIREPPAVGQPSNPFLFPFSVRPIRAPHSCATAWAPPPMHRRSQLVAIVVRTRLARIVHLPR